MSISATSLCNMALGRIGAKRLNDLAEDSSVEAIHCNLHYEQTRDALLKSHIWRFALGRSELSEDTESPDFEWNHQYILPDDYLRQVGLYCTENSYAMEGQRLLTNDDEVNLRYIRKITDPAQLTPLYVEVLVLQLAIKLVMPLSQDKVLRRELLDELAPLLADAKMVNRTETNTVGKDELDTWLDSRLVNIL